MENERGNEIKNNRKESVINNQELQVRFLAVLNIGNSHISPDLEKYAWRSFATKVDDGDIDISVLEENKVEELVKFCIPIKKEYYAKSGIITDENGNPNLEATISARPELVKTNAEVAKMVEDSAINLNKIDYKNIGLNELIDAMSSANSAERKIIFDNFYRANIFTKEQEEEFNEDYGRLTDEEKEMLFDKDIPIEKCSKNVVEFWRKYCGLEDIEIVDENGNLIVENVEKCRDATIEKTAMKALTEWFDHNSTENGLNDKISKEELEKAYALLKFLSNAKTEKGKEFYASAVLRISTQNKKDNIGLQAIEEAFKTRDKSFDPEKVNLEISSILKEHEEGLEEFNVEEAIDNNEQAYKDLKKKNIETVVNFSPRQKMMYKKLKSIEIKEIRTNQAHYARNAKMIVQMYHQLNSMKERTKEQDELKEVLEFYIKLPENVNAFGAYIKKGNIKGISDPEKERIRLNTNEVTSLREDFEKVEEKEFSMEKDALDSNNPYARTKLNKKIEKMNRDIKIEDTMARYVVLNEKLKKLPKKENGKTDEYAYERKLLTDELNDVKSTILENYSAFRDYVSYDEEAKEYVIDDGKIDKSKFVRKHESTEIYELCIDIVRLRDRSKFAELQHSKEIELKKAKLLEAISNSGKREEFEKLLTSVDENGELTINELKVMDKVTELMNYVACGHAINNIENSIQNGFEFDSLSANEKADYLENVILLMAQKDDNECQQVASLAAKRIERTGIDLRDNTGKISEDKIFKFYNSFVDENRKIDSSEEVYKRFDLEEKYRDLESYNMRYNLNHIKRAFEVVKNPQLARIQEIETEISGKDLDYILTPEEKLSEKDRKVYEVFKKLDLNDETNKETIINLYWTAKNDYLTTKDENTYQFYKSIEKVITMDTNRIQFYDYLKADFIVKHADEDIFNSTHLDLRANIVSKVKNDMEKIKGKLKPYQEIIQCADEPEKFEKLFLEKAAQEREKAEERKKTQNEKTKQKEKGKNKGAKGVNNPELDRLRTLEEYLRLREVDLEDESLTANERYKLTTRKNKIEGRLRTDESFKHLCVRVDGISDSTKDCFDVKAIQEEVDILKEKLEVPITQEEAKALEEKEEEMNISALSQKKEKASDEPVKDSEVEAQKHEEMDVSAVADEAEKAKKEPTVEVVNLDESQIVQDSPIINQNNIKDADREEADTDGEKVEQEDENEIEDVEEPKDKRKDSQLPNEQDRPNNLFSNVANSIKTFISRFTTKKISDGTDNVRDNEMQGGFFSNLINRIKGTKDDKTEEKVPSVGENIKNETSFVPQAKVNESEAVRKTQESIKTTGTKDMEIGDNF